MVESLQEQEKSFDYKQIFLKALKYWHLFILGALLGAGYAFYTVRYSIPTYSVSARIMLKDEYSGWGQEYFLPGLELVSARNRLVNEIGAIRSFPLMRKVVGQLPEFLVSYYDVGNIKTTEMYRSSPFSVSWDTLINPSIYGSSYHLRILSGNEFEVGKMTDDKFIGESYQFGDSIDISGNQIFFKLNTKYDENQHPDKLYLFSFNSPDRIAIAYQSGLQIDTEEKESSILIISRSGPTIAKEMDFINKFIEVYIEDGLAKNNLIASKVMEFVDDRISTILDTLIVVEGELESFKSKSNVARIDLEGESTLIPVIIKLEKKKLDLAFNMSYYEKLVDYVEKYDDAKGLIIPSYIEQGGLLNQVLSNLIQLYSEKVELQYDVTTTNESWRRIEEQISVSKTIIKENINIQIG